MRLKTVEVKRFRSIMDAKVEFYKDQPVVICGQNNIGKTNFLLALNLFFNHWYDDSTFEPSRDIPDHIKNGSGGKTNNTEISCTFESDGVVIFEAKAKFNNDCSITYYKREFFEGEWDDFEQIDDLKFYELVSDFEFILIKSNNVDIPKMISKILGDVLLPLDRKRKKQTDAMKSMQSFIDKSMQAIGDIEKNINEMYSIFTSFESSLSNTSIKINLAEFSKLRDALMGMATITLNDGNNGEVVTKGSGAQRLIYLTLMKYLSSISSRSSDSVIWAIDEPEVFLQPKMQKLLSTEFKEMAKISNQSVILTSHSPNFIDLNNLNSVYLFECEMEVKHYKRTPNKSFTKLNTKVVDFISSTAKVKGIKEHLGLSDNDGWKIHPFNLLVEGFTDDKYLTQLFLAAELDVPNIIICGSSTKLKANLDFLKLYARELDFKPKFVCLFDNDDAGRESAKKINPSKYRDVDVFVKYMTRSTCLPPDRDSEIEDFLPVDIAFKVINLVLRNKKLKIIRASQIINRNTLMNGKKQLIDYAMECIGQNNGDGSPLDKNDLKHEICHEFSKIKLDRGSLNEYQIIFLRDLLSVG